MHDILSMIKIVLRKILKDPDTALPLRVLFFERFGKFCKNPNFILSFILIFKTPTNTQPPASTDLQDISVGPDV